MATIKFSEGTTYRAQYTLLDETGVAIDITGAALDFASFLPNTLKVGVQPRFLSKQIGTGVTVTNAAGGVILLTFNPLETRDKAGVYEWELQLTEINGDVWLAGSGVLLIQPGRRLDT